MKNASGQPAAACKVKMSAVKKINANRNTSNKILVITYDNYSIKILIVQNNGKEMYKKCAARAIKCFC